LGLFRKSVLAGHGFAVLSALSSFRAPGGVETPYGA
jgi:hypothetical protein